MSYILSLQMPGSTRVIRRPLFRSTSRHAPRTLAMQAADAVRHYARSRGVHVLAVEWSIEGSAV